MKKQVTIDGGKSDWYEKAIFTLRDDVKLEKLPRSLPCYAEELIEGYLKKSSVRSPYSSKLQKQVNSSKYTSNKGLDYFLNASLVLCACSIIFLAYKLLI